MRGEEERGTSSIFFLMKRLRSVNRGGGGDLARTV
jgi:hypothetical protein